MDPDTLRSLSSWQCEPWGVRGSDSPQAKRRVPLVGLFFTLRDGLQITAGLSREVGMEPGPMCRPRRREVFWISHHQKNKNSR